MRSAIIAIAASMAFAGAAAWADVNPTVTTAGSAPQIVLPKDGDEYSALAARAAAQDQGVDFRALRFAWLKSAAHKHETASEVELRSAIFTAVKAHDDQGVRAAAVKMISAIYVNLYGHKFLRQACTILHDDACAAQEHFVEFGLLQSILKSGDGKTCATGWEVVSVGEEYFIIGMMGATPGQQSLLEGKPSCDMLQVTDEKGAPQTYFFRIDAVLEDEMSMLGGH